MKTLFITFKLLSCVVLNPVLPNNPSTAKYNFQKQSSKPISVINNDLVVRLLDEIDYSKVIKKYQPKKNISKEIVQNEHNSKVKDVIENFTAKGDKFSFYRAKDRNILLSMELNHKYMILDKDIYIGCDKNVFKAKYKTPLNSDVIIIQDLEGGNIFSFFFKNSKLIRATYKCEYLG